MQKPLIFLLCLAAVPAAAQPLELPAGIGAGGAAYGDAVRGRGVRTAVAYYDPGRPAPELRTDVAVEPPPAAPTAPPEPLPVERWMVAVAFALVLLAVLLLAARFGGVRAVSFARPPERGTRARAAAAPAPAADPGPDGLEAIARLADRRRALHLLLERALERAVRANGRSLARSQTPREVLRGLPAGWPPLPALRRIVQHDEVVRFGGRALTEDSFRASIDAARPIFGEGAPP